MCFKAGSIEAAVNICPMCKAFPHPRCPHVRDVCRNRNSHPTFDVHYLKNAEVDSFNGCGYCKWANLNPSLKQLDHRNPGWPGCCRPPTTAESRLIQAADWRAVSTVHHVPIPPEIKAMLDSLSKRGAMPPMSGSPRSAPSNNRPANPTFDRRSSNASITGRPTSSSKSPAVNASRGRSGSSPKQGNQAIGGNLGRSSSGTAISSSVQSPSADQSYRERRADSSSRSSPSRKQDVEGVTTPKRPSHSRRPSVTPAVPSVSVSKVVADARPQNNSQSNVKRRSSVSTASSTPPPKTPNSRPSSFVVPRTPKKDDDDTSNASSSSSGSEGLGSLSDSTITSDGAFTDYLSDESEAELQRQAEAKAALVAQSQAEELEFKAARQQLAHVDLRPPRSWNTMSYGVSSKLAPAFTSMQAAAYNLAQTAQTS